MEDVIDGIFWGWRHLFFGMLKNVVADGIFMWVTVFVFSRCILSYLAPLEPIFSPFFPGSAPAGHARSYLQYLICCFLLVCCCQQLSTNCVKNYPSSGPQHRIESQAWRIFGKHVRMLWHGQMGVGRALVRFCEPCCAAIWAVNVAFKILCMPFLVHLILENCATNKLLKSM